MKISRNSFISLYKGIDMGFIQYMLNAKITKDFKLSKVCLSIRFTVQERRKNRKAASQMPAITNI